MKIISLPKRTQALLPFYGPRILTLGAFICLQASSLESIKAQELTFEKWSGDIVVPDPVSLAVDEHGVIYCTQTQRRKSQDLDIRSLRHLIEEDVKLGTVAEKLELYKERFKLKDKGMLKLVKDHNKDGRVDVLDLTVLSERIYRLEDTNKDGVADKINVYAEDFNTPVTGIAAGVLAHDGSVYSTIAPDVWKMEDTDGDGKADKRKSIATGFGVHIAYAGHDMHGLTVGPDGRLYWTIGDKGLSVKDENGKVWHYPNQGAVLRSEFDGSNFEVFAHGLRNVQELAFAEHGNLFGVDNDADFKGEKERFLFIAKDSDTGWRANYQYRGKNYNPWTDQGLWQPHHEGRPAYCIAPIQNYVDGPFGFTYNPGTALGKGWEKTFILSSAPNGVQYAFQTKPEGAGFKMINSRTLSKGKALTGIMFGPDGALYASNWEGRYPLNQKGSVWKLDVPAKDKNPLRSTTQAWMVNDYSKLSLEKLNEAIAFDDQRVRLKAQFELVKRGNKKELLQIATSAKSSKLARVHAIWGLSQLARGQASGVKVAPQDLVSVIKSFDKEDVEVAQVFKVAQELNEFPAEVLVNALGHSSDVVKYHSLIALNKFGTPSELGSILKLVEANKGKDLYLRHACVRGMISAGTEALGELSTHASSEVQLCAVIALRKLGSPKVSNFLNGNAAVATEAAMAIYDDFSIK